ncbi:hypothetical protein M426DRAFT_319423 [Hypoxylon sp. CI-4A]|nr:hypothetical protein M426DRAFT_319423 [Hypoxylon sp. CI-4A]
MLQLGSRGAHRIGTSYICASCFAACQAARPLISRPALIPGHHSRSISSSPRQAAPSTEPSTPQPDGAEDVKPPAQEPGQEQASEPVQEPPKKKKTKKKEKSAKKPKVQAKSPPKEESDRQLEVLQGALQVLKNVLAAQNISVDQIGKFGNLTGQKEPNVPAKGKTKAKPSQETEDDASTQTAQESPDGSEKKSSKKSSKPKGSNSKTQKTKTQPATGRTGRAARKTARRARKKDAAASNPESQVSPNPAESTKETTPSPSPVKPRKVRGGQYDALRESLRKLADGDVGDLTSLRSNLSSGSDDLHGDYRIIGEPFAGEKPAVGKSTSKSKKKRQLPPIAINTISSNKISQAMKPIETDRPPVPGLSYGLERVLFNPGVYYLQDPRSRVYNFDPYLSEIMPIQEFDFNALKQYVTSSKDTNLIQIAKDHNKRYTGSTSSMTSMLSHFHYLLSSWREINSKMLSRTFVPDSVQFTRIMRGPAAVFLHWKDGTYAIDADKEYDTANILSMLGKSMEKLLTLTKEEYERYRHPNSAMITQEERNAEEAFHYTGFQDFMMRSQLDAYDPRIPGAGMFDLKTRAVVSIRMDAKGFQKGLGYEIRNRFGQWNSFEREYYDMIRSAFLKYSLQVRMGRMDGIFVAYHNTQRIFGFQYIPLEEMDLALHGTSNLHLGHREYKLSLALLNDVMDRATKKFPGHSLRMHFETRTSVGAPFMYIFAKPVSPEDINEVQNSKKASIEAFERDILGLAKDEAEAESESVIEDEEVADEEDDPEESLVQEMSSLTAWNDVRQMVEDAVDDDEVGVGAVREAIEDALEQSGLLHAKSSTEARGYVDALLDALTSTKSSKEADFSSDMAANETTGDDIVVSESEDGPNLEQVSSSDEEVSSDNEPKIRSLEADEAQETENQPNEIEEQAGQPTSADPKYTSEPNEERFLAADCPEGHTGTTVGLVDDTSSEQPPSVESNSSVSIDETSSQQEANVETSRAVEEEEEDEDDEADEAEEPDDEIEVTESRKDLNTPATMSPLKDLIVKMAQRIDEKTASDEAESSIADSSKLKEFERILGELISRSKAEQTSQQTEDTTSTAEAQPESDTQEQTESIETQPDEVSSTDSSAQSSAETTTEDKAETEPAPKPEEDEGDPELLGMVLTIKNKVNGQYVARPEDMAEGDHWVVEYNIEEIKGKRAQTIYQQCKSRRQKTFEDTGDRDSEWYKMFRGELEKHTVSGRKYREAETEKAKRHPVHVVGEEPRRWTDVFGKETQEVEQEVEAEENEDVDVVNDGKTDQDKDGDEDEKKE